MSTTSKGYHRYHRYPLDEVLRRIGKKSHSFYVPNIKKVIRVVMNQRRMLLLQRGTDCVCCGLKGEYFWLERSGCMPPHMNLYGINRSGNPVMLTADHIVPKSMGGLGVFENLQLLCSNCNGMKKNKFMTLAELKKRKGIK